jgi:hypothetical protein
MNTSNFNNYDPDTFGAGVYSDLYDPNNATGADASPAATAQTVARPGQKLQFNITISNATAKQLLVELFSAFDSVTTRKKAEYANAPYNYVPFLSFEGIALAGVGCVGFDQNGNLQIKGAALDPVCSVGCAEYPYNSMVESTKTLPFNVAYLRYTVDTDLQIDNNITWFARTFGGKKTQNEISPRAYFKPNQFQNKTIDILAPFTVDGEKGLQIPVNAGENVRLAFFVQRWAKNTL